MTPHKLAATLCPALHPTVAQALLDPNAASQAQPGPALHATLAGIIEPSALPLATYLDQLAAFGGELDLPFLVLSMEIQDKDNQIAAKIKTIQQQARFREVIGKKLDQLRKLKTLLQGAAGKALDDDAEMSLTELAAQLNMTPGEPVTIHAMGGNKQIDTTTTVAQTEKLAQELGLDDVEYFYDPETGKITEQSKGPIGAKKPFSQMSAQERCSYRINADQVEEKIKSLTDVQQRIDSEREIDMVMLNALINKKSQATQLLSNIVKKEHDTQSAVIGNIR